jgi:YD repeat-containing protein
VGNRTSLTYADGRVVSSTYYRNDWLKSVTDPEGNVTRYTRDGVGQMTRTENPNSTVTEATYDKADRLLTLVNLCPSELRCAMPAPARRPRPQAPPRPRTGPSSPG